LAANKDQQLNGHISEATAKPLQLFSTFFKIGAFTFGGGYAMLPIIKREITERHQWLSDETFVDVLAVAQSSPGAVAVNSAVFTGYKLCGFPGAFSALLGVVMPSFLVILIIAVSFSYFTINPVIQAAFNGIRPAIAALIGAAVIKIGKPVLKKKQSIVMAVVFFLLFLLFDLHPIYIILLGIGIGLLFETFISRTGSEGGTP
jgi:chromate transporter